MGGEWMGMLKFEKRGNFWDTNINGLGHNVWFADVQNSLLRTKEVSERVPIVAEQTQGEVIQFAGAAADAMSKDGVLVVMEGREQTLQFVRTKHRFELVMKEPKLIGERQAALKIMGKVAPQLDEWKGLEKPEAEGKIKNAISEALKAIANQ